MNEELDNQDACKKCVVRSTSRFLITNFIYLLLIAAALWACLAIDPIKRNGYYGTHYFRLVLAGVSIVLFIAFLAIRSRVKDLAWPWSINSLSKRSHAAKIIYTLLIVACIFGAFNYYQFDRTKLTQVGDYSDATYYYINSKYFEELDYFELYPAMLVADSETNNRLRNIKRYRDLHNYEDVVPKEKALENADAVKSAFTPERWEEFKHDVDFLVSHSPSGGWDYFFIDHGYNPPPTWTIVGGTLSKMVSVENLKRITMVDFALVVIMFVVLAYAFNAETMLFGLLFFLCTFSGRWPILGQSILRFDWLVALVLAVCMLKKGRHALSGVFLCYSALNRIFPAIFFWSYAVVVCVHFFKKRRPANEHIRFTVGAFIMLIVLVGSAWHTLGLEAFKTSARNLRMHGSWQSYSSHRVGLGDAVFYRGELTFDDMKKHGAAPGKGRLIQQIEPHLNILGLMALGLIAAYVIRTKKPIHELVYLSIIPLFCMQNAQINYYNLRLLLIMAHMGGLDKWRNRFGLVFLFLIEIVTQYSHIMGNWRYTTTCMTSIGLAVYLLIMVVLMLRDLRRIGDERYAKMKNGKDLE